MLGAQCFRAPHALCPTPSLEVHRFSSITEPGRHPAHYRLADKSSGRVVSWGGLRVQSLEDVRFRLVQRICLSGREPRSDSDRRSGSPIRFNDVQPRTPLSHPQSLERLQRPKPSTACAQPGADAPVYLRPQVEERLVSTTRTQGSSEVRRRLRTWETKN